jgi:transcriptional regulator with XRE-family HTH domain
MMHGSLPAKLRVLRARQGLTLLEAAEKTGVGRDTLSSLEKGNQRPVMPTLAKLAQGYGVDVEEILETEELAVPLGEAPGAGPPQVSRERLQEHFENVRQNEVDYLNWMIADFWRLALPGEKPEKLEAHFPPEDIDTDRIWQFLEHALGARNVFGPEEAERIKRGAVRKAALAR